jgi:hypothetical protein
MDDADVLLGRCELKALQADATVNFSLPFAASPFPPPRSPSPPPAPPLCAKGTVLAGAQGAFDDGSEEGASYQPNADCSWLITVAAGARARLELTRLDLEREYDFLAVFNAGGVLLRILR